VASANVEIVLRMFEAVNSQDVELIAANMTPDAVVDVTRSIGPNRGVFTGPDVLRRQWPEWQESWAAWTWEAERVTDVPPDRVVIAQRSHGEGSLSGIAVDARVGQLWELEGGRLERLTMFQTEAEALAAAGAAHVAVVRRMYEGFHSGDAEAATACFSPDVVVDATRRVDGEMGHGREELGAIIGRWIGAFEEWSEELEEVTALPGGHVLVVATQRGRGRSSGLATESRYAVLYRVENAAIAEMTLYPGPDEAYERLGWS
jgi:ketosteroid isomerase-like protein